VPPAASTFSRAVADAEQLDVLAQRPDQALRLERLGCDLVAAVEAGLEVAQVDRLRVRAERPDRHRVGGRVPAELGRAHVQRHLAALEAGAHGV